MTNLADVVVQQALFLATASDDEINPDIAIKQLEALAYATSRLPGDEQALLRGSIASRTTSARDEEREILEEMAENLGL